MKEIGSSLHSILVAVTWGRHVRFVAWLWYWFALPNDARSHKRRYFSPYTSKYSPNSAAAPLHCNAQTELCTVYVMILHVPILSHTNIHSIFLQLLKTHMAFRMLQFLVRIRNATTVSGHVIIHPAFLPPLLSRWYKWYWVAPAQRFKTVDWYSTSKFQKFQSILCIHQNNQIWMYWLNYTL